MALSGRVPLGHVVRHRAHRALHLEVGARLPPACFSKVLQCQRHSHARGRLRPAARRWASDGVGTRAGGRLPRPSPPRHRAAKPPTPAASSPSTGREFRSCFLTEKTRPGIHSKQNKHTCSARTYGSMPHGADEHNARASRSWRPSHPSRRALVAPALSMWQSRLPSYSSGLSPPRHRFGANHSGSGSTRGLLVRS